jgi:hypothetical protein
MVDDDMKLTEQEKRIKLAKADGWDESPSGKWSNNGFILPDPLNPPDYFNDLNAVQELQDKLTNDQQFEFVYHLNDVLELVPLSSPASYREVVLFAFANATATQRSEALGKTLNLW